VFFFIYTTPAFALDELYTEYGRADATIIASPAWAKMYRVGAMWNWNRSWLNDGDWHVTGFRDLSLAHLPLHRPPLQHRLPVRPHHRFRLPRGRPPFAAAFALRTLTDLAYAGTPDMPCTPGWGDRSYLPAPCRGNQRQFGGGIAPNFCTCVA
jgi:hypothetical protein